MDEIIDVRATPAPAEPESELPAVSDPDTRVTRPKEVRRQARRHFLQMIGAAGVGVGLAFTDSLSTRFARPAGAAAYEMWGECRGYFSSTTTCVPSSAYYGSDNCTGDWHRQEYLFFPDVVWGYLHHGFSCNGRNAWLWRWRTDGWSTKCSDGYVESYHPLTFQLLSSQFSICRTSGFY
jgi:hypothetical protein